jgi:FtsZ-binding cell division protein ZapB
VPDIYRRQAETISSLTEENEKLVSDVTQLKAKEERLAKIESEKDDLLEQLSTFKEQVRALTSRADTAEAAKKSSETELEKLVTTRSKHSV